MMLHSLRTAENPTADFSHDNIWVVLVKALVIFVFLVVMTLFAIWWERKVVARMQSRPGPNRVGGRFGALQSLADGVKLAFKEDLIPALADVPVFLVAPIISCTAAFVAFAVIPLGPAVTIPFTHIVTPLQLTDLPVAVLYVLAVAAVGVYGIVLAGWSSGSTYPLLGGLRSSAQVISYEIAMGLALISVFLVDGSMSTSAIVAAQSQVSALVVPGLNLHVPVPGWNVFALFPAFVIYVIAMVGETNRAPFDLPEAEGELVGGFHTEYSSLKFALFFLAEYVNMVTVSAIATTLFLGGWQAPVPGAVVHWTDQMVPWLHVTSGWWGILWFIGKLLMFIWFFIWLRGTLPRLRYDQFMNFGWKVLIPAALVWVIVISIVMKLRSGEVAQFSGTWLAIAGLMIVVLVGAVLFFDGLNTRRGDQERALRMTHPEEVDPFAGGFPVPPLPGQRLIRTNGRVVVAGGTTVLAEAEWARVSDSSLTGDPAAIEADGAVEVDSESEADDE